MTWKGSAPSILLFLMILSGGLPLLAGGQGVMAGSNSPSGAPAIQKLQWLELPASSGRTGSLWIWNLGDRMAQVTLASSRPLRVAAGSFREVTDMHSGWVSFRPGSQLVFVSASRDLDPSDFELDLRGAVRMDETEPAVVHLTRPAWAQDLLVQAAGRSPVGPGGTLDAAPEVGEDGRARFALGLLDEGSAAVVTLRDWRGTELESFSVAAAMPVRLRAALGASGEIDDARADVKVVRGRAVTSSMRGGIQLKSIQGSCSASNNLVFSGSYTYSCTGGQANVCGELDIVRNGVSQSTPGWFCTDGSGNGTMGPWNWSDKASDETGDPIYITWPNGNTTNSTYIIVDKNYARTYIDSSMPTTTTPTSYNGHATDATWGTGFDFGFVAFSVFQDRTTGNYWSPSSGQYNAGYTEVTPSSISHSGRWYVSWTTSFPSVGSHTTGHLYRWYTCFTDAQNGYCTGAGPGITWSPYEFTAN
jgi:hypothetical protein